MFYDEIASYKSELPQIFHNIVEIDELNQTINIQLDKMNAVIKETINNKSVMQSNERGIARWEKILGISSPLNSSLIARKEAVKSKLMTKPPINVVTLKNIIEAYMGLVVDISVDNFMVLVKYRGTSRIEDLTPLYMTVYETIPANLILSIVYAYLTYMEEQKRFVTYKDQNSYTYKQIMRGEFA